VLTGREGEMVGLQPRPCFAIIPHGAFTVSCYVSRDSPYQRLKLKLPPSAPPKPLSPGTIEADTGVQSTSRLSLMSSSMNIHVQPHGYDVPAVLKPCRLLRSTGAHERRHVR